MTHDLVHNVTQLSNQAVLIGVILVLVLALLATAFNKRKYKKYKPWIFGSLVAVITIPTLILVGSTIYLNTHSYSHGPVHWHAEFEVWACSKQVDLRNPSGLSNRIGTATLHEHNDSPIHVEGVVVDPARDASLGKFFSVVGGSLSERHFSIPLNRSDVAPPPEYAQYVSYHSDGPYASFTSGASCEGQSAQVQVFAYRYNKTTKAYTQQKLVHPEDWVIAPESQIPPGDCLIIEFDTPKDQTDHMCRQPGHHGA